jgi:hypothetical protein
MVHARHFADAGPLVIGGMHRSGTSLTASLFAGAGIDLGPELLGATRGNVRGHFEDTGFLDFHMRVLVAQGHGQEGFVTHPCTVPPLFEPVARRIVAERAASGRPWGWKEPRTILFLDFWQRIVPNARYVFVFRSPSEVIDSIFRRGDSLFLDKPAFALDIWIRYNRLIIDFVRRHPDRCVVVDIGHVIGDPEGTLAKVRTRLDVPLGPAPACFDPVLFTRDESALHTTIVHAAAPAAGDVLAELRDMAGYAQGGAGPSTPIEPTMAAACAMSEWSRACRAEVAMRDLLARQEPPAPSAWRAWSRRITKPLERFTKAVIRRGNAAGQPCTPASPRKPQSHPGAGQRPWPAPC